jgi:uncharacterized membrane protein
LIYLDRRGEGQVKELQSKETKPANSPSLRDEVSSQVRKLLLAVLIILRVTITFVLAILADYLIIVAISWTFGSTINSVPFAAYLLKGIQLLSALGTALAYILFLIRSLFRDLQETRDTFSEDKDKK